MKGFGQVSQKDIDNKLTTWELKELKNWNPAITLEIEKATSTKHDIMWNKQKVMIKQYKVTRNRSKLTSNKQKAKSNKVTINEQKVKSNNQKCVKQRAKSNE